MEHNNQVLPKDVWQRNAFPSEKELGEDTVQITVKKSFYDRKGDVELVNCFGITAPLSKKLLLEGYMGYHLVSRETA